MENKVNPRVAFPRVTIGEIFRRVAVGQAGIVITGWPGAHEKMPLRMNRFIELTPDDQGKSPAFLIEDQRCERSGMPRITRRWPATSMAALRITPMPPGQARRWPCPGRPSQPLSTQRKRLPGRQQWGPGTRSQRRHVRGGATDSGLPSRSRGVAGSHAVFHMPTIYRCS